jgi:ABC-2 type transport system ATP-binding protein
LEKWNRKFLYGKTEAGSLFKPGKEKDKDKRARKFRGIKKDPAALVELGIGNREAFSFSQEGNLIGCSWNGWGKGKLPDMFQIKIGTGVESRFVHIMYKYCIYFVLTFWSNMIIIVLYIKILISRRSKCACERKVKMNDREIVVENLVKSYSGKVKVTAVDGINFRVEKGKIFGFLGPNGAGKSTTIKILTTLALPTSGHATVGGFDVVSQATEVRRVAGVALQEVGIDPLMKSMELLVLQGRLFGASKAVASMRAKELLELVQLSEAIDRQVGTYSGGMRRRLDLAMALVQQPKVLFLDEPTTGLDPVSRRDVWQEVRRLNRELGITIFLTTQYLEEADELADSVAIIVGGKIVAEGSPAKLKAAMGEESINLVFESPELAGKGRTTLETMGKRIQLDRDTVRLYLSKAAGSIPNVINRLQKVGLAPISLTLTQPTLDDVFLQVTGQRLVASEAVKSKTSRSLEREEVK